MYENNGHHYPPVSSSSRLLPRLSLSPENFMLQIMGRLIYDIFVCQEEEQQQQGTNLNLGNGGNLYNSKYGEQNNPYAFNNGMNNEFEQEGNPYNTYNRGRRSSMSFTFGSSNNDNDEGGLRLEDTNNQRVRMDGGRSSSYTFGSDDFVKLRNTNQVDAQRMTQSLNDGQTTLSTNSLPSAIQGPCSSSSYAYLPQRTNKRMYKEKKSLFSEVVKRGYPISICRLLSDMIDIGSDGMADSPYTTLDDVVHDLLQMSTDPELFLYNPEEGFSSNLRFGVGCYGRESEVASILGLASKLDESNTEKDPASSSPSSSVDDGMQAIFASGIAGSGKSFLAHTAAKCLEIRGRSSCWIVLGAKFEIM